jgi:hypothetical protein
MRKMCCKNKQIQYLDLPIKNEKESVKERNNMNNSNIILYETMALYRVRFCGGH